MTQHTTGKTKYTRMTRIRRRYTSMSYWWYQARPESIFVEQDTALPDESHDAARTLLHGLSSTTTCSGRGLPGASPPPLAPAGDTPWAVAFALNVAITLLSAVFFFPSALKLLALILKPHGWKSSDIVGWIFRTCFFVAALAVAVSSIVMCATKPGQVKAQVALVVYVLVLAAVMVALPGDLVPLSAAVLPILGGVISDRLLPPSRTQFAAANLRIATMAISSTLQMILWALCAAAIRCVWFAIGVVACVGSIAALAPGVSGTATRRAVYCQDPWVLTAWSWECWVDMLSKSNESSTAGFLLIFWTVSVSWSSAVALNVVAATVADSVAMRWSLAGNWDSLWQSCRRVIRSSLGSLCKVAALDCLYWPLWFLAGRLFYASRLAECLLFLIRIAVKYVLLQPVIFIGARRLNFAEAVRHAKAMFFTHGRTLLINDAVMVAACSFSGAVAAVLPAAVAVVCAFGYIFTSPPSPSVPNIVFICAMLTILATLEVLLYAFKAVFVSLVEAPESLAVNLGSSVHEDLHNAWRQLQSPAPTTTTTTEP